MTQAALDGANPVILTSDNPRTEDPEQIFADMKQGINFSGHRMHEIHDRREAIKFVAEQAQAGDIVVIAAKDMKIIKKLMVCVTGLMMWLKCVPRLMPNIIR